MKGVKVRKVKIPMGENGEDIGDMFNQMLGAGSMNLSICYPKYQRIKKLCAQYLKLLGILADAPFLKSKSEFQPALEQINAHITENAIDRVFTMDLDKYEWNFNTIEEPLKKEFEEHYEAIKKSNLTRSAILTCDRLIPHKSSINDLAALNPKFLTNMTSPEFLPLPFTNLNFKYLFTLSDISENNIRFFMTVLHKAHELTFKIWQESVSPDVDVEQFVEVIMSNIEEIQKKAPELARCNKAFGKIRESVSLLQDQFSGYYRDFVQTKDSTIIMQNFILDVSQQSGADPEVMREFRVIIKYYRKLAGQQKTHPKLKMLFDKVNSSFKELEKGTQNLVNIKTDDGSKDGSKDGNKESKDGKDSGKGGNKEGGKEGNKEGSKDSASPFNAKTVTEDDLKKNCDM
tara:strand:+ start:7496 stop:8701 length:1206 start_codon:yes stop_codon:yes gene_type:complete